MTTYCQDCGRQINDARGCRWCAIGKDLTYTCQLCGKTFPNGVVHDCYAKIKFATYQDGYDACKKEYENNKLYSLKEKDELVSSALVNLIDRIERFIEIWELNPTLPKEKLHPILKEFLNHLKQQHRME